MLGYDNAHMAEAGTPEILDIEYPHRQVLTVVEMLDRKQFATSTVADHQVLAPGLLGIPAVGV